MTASSHSDQLLDLLYGELTAEEEARLRRAIAEDDDLQAEWAALESTHQAVRAHVPEPQEVSAELRDSIMAAASEAVRDRPGRRTGGIERRSSIWSTFLTGGRLQAAVTLGVLLLTSATVYTLFNATYVLGPNVTDEVSSVSVAGAPEPGAPAAADDFAYEEIAEEEAPEPSPEPGFTPAPQPTERDLAQQAPPPPAPEEPRVDRVADRGSEQPAIQRRARNQAAPEQAQAPRARPRRAAPQPQPRQERAEEEQQSVELLDGFGSRGAIGRAGSGDRAAGSPPPAAYDSLAEAEPEPAESEGAMIDQEIAAASEELAEAAEAEEEPSDDAPTAEELLTAAEEARIAGDEAAARQHLEQLLSDEFSATLSETMQRQARDLLEDIEEDERIRRRRPSPERSIEMMTR